MNRASFNKIHRKVFLGTGVLVEDFCILGHPARGRSEGEDDLVIGADSLIRSHTVIYEGGTIGDRFQTGHRVLIRENASIGNDCSIGSGSILEGSVHAGDSVRVHSGCFVPEFSVLEDGCWLGPHVVLTNAKYPASPRAKQLLDGVRVGARAKIGANATVLPGVCIGACALIGAGSVVTKDVAAFDIVLGNPAHAIGSVADLRETDTGRPVYELLGIEVVR